MIIAVEILPQAQRMLDEATEYWIAEHGFLAENPLLEAILHVSDLLRRNPRLGRIFRAGRPEIRRLLVP